MVRIEATFNVGDRMTPEIALKLAQQAEKYVSSLLIEYENTSILLDSLIGVLSLELYRGKNLFVVADGTDEIDAAEAIRNVLSAG